MSMTTTVIGSYPAKPSAASLANQHLEGDYSTDPYIAAIDASVKAQLDAGIELVSDGQTRDNMINLYAARLGGARVHGVAKIIGDIYHKENITVEDQRHVRTLVPEGVKLKGMLTGPFTLAKSCRDEHYGDLEGAAFAFADALNEEARALQEVVDVIQIDEPFFSEDFPDYAGLLIGRILDGVNIPRALHVCGDVGPIFKGLVEMKVDLLEHEFAANPGLLDVVGEMDFPQKLGLGSVRSDKEEVEPVPDIASHIQRAVDAFGPDKLVISPDCGLRHLSKATAFNKLKNMVAARNEVMQRG
jgi:5-methyltetrahydropteroyltriglutamate--homocysteine methyltransferase